MDQRQISGSSSISYISVTDVKKFTNFPFLLLICHAVYQCPISIGESFHQESLPMPHHYTADVLYSISMDVRWLGGGT